MDGWNELSFTLDATITLQIKPALTCKESRQILSADRKQNKQQSKNC